MKKFTYWLGWMFLSTFLASTTHAQIPNSGFENWVMYGNGMNPEGWWSSNDSINPSDTYFPVTRSTDHFPLSVGEYSIRLETQSSLAGWSAGGIAWTGNWDGNNYPAFQITGHPNSLCGYYKYIPQGLDSMDIHIRLYKNGADIAGGILRSGLTNNWTAFSIPISGYVDADSARIMMVGWDIDQYGLNPQGNSVLYFDNLSFDILITSLNQMVPSSSTIELNVFPNPGNDVLYVKMTKDTRIQSELKIFNALWQEVYIKFVTGLTDLTIDINNYAEGVYYVRLTTGDNQALVKKVQILP